MNMFKKNGGFTLVELIVVIAILAILAGIAVPAYSGYIQKANDAAVLSELSAIQTAAQSACALEGTSVTKIVVSTAGKVTLTPETADADINTNFADFYKTTEADLAKLIAKHKVAKTSGATWEGGEWDILKDE